METKQINFAPLFIGLAIIIIYALSSCVTGGEGCQGNRKMLNAGAGYTKFNK